MNHAVNNDKRIFGGLTPLWRVTYSLHLQRMALSLHWVSRLGPGNLLTKGKES
jgi:hypothetical protein